MPLGMPAAVIAPQQRLPAIGQSERSLLQIIDTLSHEVAWADRRQRSLTGDRRSVSKGERQRQAILSSLATLLVSQPILDLTVGQIAAEARVPRSGFYTYFESKYAALAVLIAEIWDDLMVQTKSYFRARGESADDFLARTIRATYELFQEHGAVVVAVIQSLPLDPNLASMWRSLNEPVVTMLAKQITDDVRAQDAIPAHSDVRALAAVLTEMTSNAIYMGYVNGSSSAEMDRILEIVRSVWLASGWGER